eukprot:NODE_7477_length_774_cov_72.155146_g6866_i0.p1 GENE.NODE_7477_length_774_cov_72.155146_g6866_i0~~NODE_7477_length_774_cov_72.155146_g6866_i0.p1  ORF type:complete len:214 (+),score=30.68 NODE_7477_length_774_cov_72.155146_g6866_i0:51-692(+)
MIKLIFVLLVFLVQNNQAVPSPPLWGDGKAFDVKVNISTGSRKYSWSFQYYWDWNNRHSAYYHDQNQMDEVCRYVQGHESGKERCNVIMEQENYLVWFPDSATCCHWSSGAGMIRPDWMLDGKYIGDNTIEGKLCHGWLKYGASDNHFYAADDSTPCLFYEHKNSSDVDPAGIKEWDFIMDTYHARPQDQSKFVPGVDCSNSCPLIPGNKKIN